MLLVQLSHHSIDFPSPDTALRNPEGLLAVGGDLRPDRLKEAYRCGIFPWFNEDEPILWWSPNPRAVLIPEQLHLSRSMLKFLRRTDYRITLNHAFNDVIHACAAVRQFEGTWINSEIAKAYTELHQQGFAHSVEVWQENTLVGGLYGIEQGALFCGESMFSLRDNASKCALIAFCRHFVRYGGKLIDCQVLNPHTASLGAHEMERAHFLQHLSRYQQSKLAPECWQPQSLVLNDEH